jgi:hypothetical protein
MTDQECGELEREIVWQREKAHQELAGLEIKVALIADSLGRIAAALRDHPELVTATPAPTSPDFREDLKTVDRQALLDTCHEFAQAKEKLRQAQKRLEQVRFGNHQTRIDV